MVLFNISVCRAKASPKLNFHFAAGLKNAGVEIYYIRQDPNQETTGENTP